MEKVGRLRLGPRNTFTRARNLWPNVANVADCGQLSIKGLRDLKLPHQYRAIISYPMMLLLLAGVVGVDLPWQWVDTYVADCGQCGRLWPLWPIVAYVVADCRDLRAQDSREFRVDSQEFWFLPGCLLLTYISLTSPTTSVLGHGLRR